MSTRKMVLRFVTAASLLIAAGGSFRGARAEIVPQDQALPCRPTIACTADIVPAGTVELEAGVLRRQFPGDGAQWTAPFLIKLTVTPRLQIQIGSNGYTISRGEHVPAQYLDDVTIGSKIHLADQTVYWPSLSISASVSVPTFQRMGYLRTYDLLLALYATKDLGPLHIDLNAGLNLWRIEGDPLPQGFLALATSAMVTGPLAAMVELYGFSDAAPVATRDAGVLLAAAWSMRTWLILDAGSDLALVRSTRLFSLFAGMTLIPAALWR